jgi:nucleoside-diphosphate-sugar epimerase
MKASRPAARTLITGATGFLGRHLLDALHGGHGRVRLLARSVPTNGVDAVQGSVLDRAAVRRAVEGCDRIYHLAGRVSRRREDAADLYRLHVDGTRVLCEEAVRAGVRRLVLVSTSGTMAVSDDPAAVPAAGPGDALQAVRRWPYYLSKIYQERETLGFLDRGLLEVVIVNPSLLLGPGDERESSTGDVVRFLRRQVPVVPEGGLSFVDVRDVAALLPAAMDRGRPGERYLCGAANWTMARFLERLEQLSGVSAPRLRLPPGVAKIGARLIDALDALGRTPPLDPVSAEMSRCFWYVDSSKAERELGFSPREPSETLVDTIRDVRQRLALG